MDHGANMTAVWQEAHFPKLILVNNLYAIKCLDGVQQYVKITWVQIRPTGGRISYFCTFWKMPRQSMTQFYPGNSTGDKLAAPGRQKCIYRKKYLI